MTVQIAAGEPRGLSLWSQHIDQLLRITLLRREMYGHEPYSFIVWWVANIDTHVVLSGMGNGDFVETMLRNNMLPSGMDPQNPYHTYDNTSPSRGFPSPNGHEALPSALAFHRRISVLAAGLGLLARDIRAEERQKPNDRSHAVMQSRQERIGVLQDTLRRTWNVQMPVSVASGYCNQILPVGARGIFEHVSDAFSLSVDNSPYSSLSDLCRPFTTKSVSLVRLGYLKAPDSKKPINFSTCIDFVEKSLYGRSLTEFLVLRALPRLLDLLSHLHVQHPTPPLTLVSHPRGVPVRGRDPPLGPRDRLPQPPGAQVHRLPALHVRLRVQEPGGARGDPRAGEEDGGGQRGPERGGRAAAAGDCVRAAGEAAGGAAAGGGGRGAGGRGLGGHDRGAGAAGRQLSAVRPRAGRWGVGARETCPGGRRRDRVAKYERWFEAFGNRGEVPFRHRRGTPRRPGLERIPFICT